MLKCRILALCRANFPSLRLFTAHHGSLPFSTPSSAKSSSIAAKQLHPSLDIISGVTPLQPLDILKQYWGYTEFRWVYLYENIHTVPPEVLLFNTEGLRLRVWWANILLHMWYAVRRARLNKVLLRIYHPYIYEHIIQIQCQILSCSAQLGCMVLTKQSRADAVA